MDKLENFMIKNDNGTIGYDIFNQYKKFGYENEELFKFHVKFMLKNLYNIQLVDKEIDNNDNEEDEFEETEQVIII